MPNDTATVARLVSLPATLLIARDYFPPQVGGISTIMQRVVTDVGPREVVTLTAGSGPAHLDTPEGPARVFRSALPFRWPTPLDSVLMLSLIAAIRLRHRIRVLLLASSGEAYVGQLGRRAFGFPYVVFAHGNEVLALQDTEWQRSRTALNGAGAVIANSRYTAQILQDLGVPAERVHVVHPGCDTDQFHAPTGAERAAKRTALGVDDRFVLLTVGNLVERKGHDTVMHAVARLRERIPNILYIVAGTGRHHATLQGLVEDLGIAGCVRFLGRVSNDELPALYGACDAFVMPSRFRESDHDVEGFGIVYVEAGACGCPVIGGRSGGVEDAVLDERTGLLVDSTDVEALAQAIVRLWSDPTLRERLGAAGCERAGAELTWQHFAARVIDIVNDAVRNPK
jgi:phosphatidylinositol alpha-1,6-mannosyltransferase